MLRTSQLRFRPIWSSYDCKLLLSKICLWSWNYLNCLKNISPNKLPDEVNILRAIGIFKLCHCLQSSFSFDIRQTDLTIIPQTFNTTFNAPDYGIQNCNQRRQNEKDKNLNTQKLKNTLAPRIRSWFANALPSPCPDPVMIATFPWWRNWGFLIGFHNRSLCAPTWSSFLAILSNTNK